MVLARRLEERRRLDRSKIDRRIEKLDAAGHRQQILLIHVLEIEQQQGRRKAGRIRVPEQQVEGGGILAQQVVIDHERPDQIVGAQHVEGPRHLLAVEVALLFDIGLDLPDLGFIAEDPQLAGFREIHLRGEEGRGLDTIVVMRCHIGEGGRQQRAADAVADRSHVFLAGRSFDCGQGRQDAFRHIVVETLVPQRLVRINPGHQEDGIALLGQPFDV